VRTAGCSLSVYGPCHLSGRIVTWSMSLFGTNADRIAYRPISTNLRQTEGNGSAKGMELQTVTFRSKHGLRHACICHDEYR
jgi:hypothetical protein